MATGNTLPRVRPNLTWGIRTHQTLQNQDLWRRVHRLTGYIRVLTGWRSASRRWPGCRG